MKPLLTFDQVLPQLQRHSTKLTDTVYGIKDGYRLCVDEFDAANTFEVVTDGELSRMWFVGGGNAYLLSHTRKAYWKLTCCNGAVEIDLNPREATLHIPVINLNGTSAEELIEQRREAYKTLGVAMCDLRVMGPHGRDYQTANPGAYEAAREVYNKRIIVLSDMRDEIWTEILNLQDQVEARKR